jgi:mRNA-degrading endonuclease RelE of RelBE toxin-antitoxin system
MYETLKKNGYLCTDEEAERRLKTGEYRILFDYGKDEKLLLYIPYIPPFYTDLINKD